MAQQKEKIFYYVPTDQEMSIILQMRTYLKNLELNKITITDSDFERMLANNINKNTFQSLIFEAFLRSIRNEILQSRVLMYFEKYKIKNEFSDSIKMLYSAKEEVLVQDKESMIHLNYENIYFDENIDLFNSIESDLLDGSLGILLFDNKWQMISIQNKESKENVYFLNYGGGTNAVRITCTMYKNIEEKNIESKMKFDYYNKLYRDGIRVAELPMVGVVKRSGATRYLVAYGMGEDTIPGVESITVLSYLYNDKTKILYELSYFMNISKANIHYHNRYRIFNILYFYSMLSFIK